VPGVMMLIVGVLYWKYTQDCPQGNYKDLRAAGVTLESGGKGGGAAVFKAAMVNYRVWMLFVTYGLCFGIELFVHNVAASYYVDKYGMDLQHAGLAAGSFGLLALFARALGGIVSDRIARAKGLDGRTLLLFALMLGEGIGLIWFSSVQAAGLAIFAMIVFGLFTHMACGATYALVPFIDRKSLGGVAGIIGAGGNVGAVSAGFLLKALGDVQLTFFYLGVCVLIGAVCAITVRFSSDHKAREAQLYDEAVASRQSSAVMQSSTEAVAG
jgi:NNP family nitrate/nitrite transporter-like MFS transporter